MQKNRQGEAGEPAPRQEGNARQNRNPDLPFPGTLQEKLFRNEVGS